MEASLNSITRLVALVGGLVLILNITPSWGGPPNPTPSDTANNTAGGSYALGSVSGGSNNTAFGDGALTDNRTGSHNTAIGVQALEVNGTTSYNTAIGEGALQFNQGDHNTATGYDALCHNFTGSYNAAHGVEALFSNVSGGGLTASGARALYSNTTGNNNAAHGALALFSNTKGTFNTATGVNALYSNDEASFNTAVGGQALYYNVSGVSNTALGVNALGANISGNNNTALGTNALFNSTGNKNIAIGYQAGINLTGGGNNIYIGSAGGASVEGLTIRIGKAQTQTFIAGVGTANVSGAPVVVDGNGQLGIVFSSARYKQDIAPMGSRSEKVLDLRPVTFAYKDDAKGTTQYGLIAEEVAAVYPDLVTHTATGEVQAVRYQELIPMLVNELQHEHQEVAGLRKELAELRALVAGQLAGQRTIAGGSLFTQSETDEASR